MVDPVDIPARSYLLGDAAGDVNALVAKVNELAAARGIATLSIPTRVAGTGDRDLFRQDMNALRAKIDALAASVSIAGTGLSDWPLGYDVTTEHSRMNTFVTKVNGVVAAHDTVPTLASPTGLSATVVSSSQISVQWNPVSGASGYNLYRNGAIVAANHPSTSFADSGLAPATTYSYQVEAVAGAVVSALSAAVSATTQGTPPEPAPQLTAVPAGPDKVDLDWTAV